MKTLLEILLLWMGSAFILLAAVGVVRFPDVFMRIHAATKAGTLGLATIAAAVALHFDSAVVTFEAILIIFFILLTAPVAAHVIGRVAYLSGVPLWERSVCNEISGAHPPPPVTTGPRPAQVEVEEEAP